MNLCSMGCGGEAIARFALSAGCVARRDDREQDLCYHHAMRSEPLGAMTLLLDYSQDHAFSRLAWGYEPVGTRPTTERTAP